MGKSFTKLIILEINYIITDKNLSNTIFVLS